MCRICFTVLAVLLPFSALAAEEPITRRDGFLLIWQSISRPAYEVRLGFSDMGEGSTGELEIQYARSRGILDDQNTFRPDDTLLLEDALLWMYRTRNIAELPDMQRSDLSRMISEYPIAEEQNLSTQVTRGELIKFMQIFDEMLRKEVHEVSFYADDFHGKGTAFGETFDMYAITAAHRSFPQDTLVKVTNVESGESVVVRINDRGPYVHGRDMDLSLVAFEKIAYRGQGVLRARFERLGDKDLVDSCKEQKRMYQKRIVRDVRFHRGIPHTFTTGEELVLQANRYFVLRGITFPDGVFLRMQDFVSPEEKFRFTAGSTGKYVFLVGTVTGHVREMRMHVSPCGSGN